MNTLVTPSVCFVRRSLPRVFTKNIAVFCAELLCAPHGAHPSNPQDPSNPRPRFALGRGAEKIERTHQGDGFFGFFGLHGSLLGGDDSMHQAMKTLVTPSGRSRRAIRIQRTLQLSKVKLMAAITF